MTKFPTIRFSASGESRQYMQRKLPSCHCLGAGSTCYEVRRTRRLEDDPSTVRAVDVGNRGAEIPRRAPRTFRILSTVLTGGVCCAVGNRRARGVLEHPVWAWLLVARARGIAFEALQGRQAIPTDRALRT
eukprot:scaffold1748_cov258-Pinguiococcus_pyrenoidosus.AAC.18